ncbi:T7SS effector LXG polymorphic toxin [Listeria immobilis]|uniref:T7SS effector LXG polymorphic toxin n=1 Tax=Listeria immobilis TaxID=2713502 RepID=UPI0016295567|nr:T7SS effector LXG polymorphic toxin [Listeria immobilis]MBC1517274.1 hypothetical protein [Listeria immobilis]MBC6298344.1 hypothetical protein [Listeria immobilis]
MGIDMYLGEVESQTTSVETFCQLTIDGLEDVIRAIDAFNMEPSLQGKTYASAKQYFMETYRVLAQGMIFLCEDLQEPNKKLTTNFRAEVANTDVIEEELVQQIEEMERLQADLKDMLSEFPLLKPMDNIYTMCKKNLVTKLENLRLFHQTSATYFDSVIQQVKNLQVGITEVLQHTGFNASTGTFSTMGMNMEWASPIIKEAKEKENRAVLKEAGLTEKEIEKLEDMGYDIGELVAQYNSIKENENDRDFFVDLLKRDYSKVFSENPDKLSQDMQLILANHLARLVNQPDEQREQKLSELEIVSNALIRYGDSGNAKKFAVNIAAMCDVMGSQSTALMMNLNPNSKSYSQMENKFNQYRGLHNLMLALATIPTPSNSMMNPATGQGYSDWYSLNKLTIDRHGQIGFNLNYHSLSYTAIEGNNIEDAIVTKDKGPVLISNLGTVGGFLSDKAAKISKLKKEKEELLDTTVMNIFKDGLGIFNPIFKLEADVLTHLYEKDYTALSKEVIDTGASKLGSKGNIISGLTSIYQEVNEYKEAVAKLDSEKNETTKAFFNAVINNGGVSIDQEENGTYHIAGVPDIQSVRAKQEIDTNGLTRYLNETEQADLQKIYGVDGLNSAEAYILAEGDRKLEELNPNELNAALNRISDAGEGNKNIDDFADWLKKTVK